MTNIPVLTYHANNINGTAYHNNDHVALAADLDLIHELGFQIITIDQLIAWHSGQLTDDQVERAVVLTCDDGTWFDYHDLDHPTCGHQVSFFNLLKQHQINTKQPVHMSNFVIVSPAARVILDEKCLIGQGWWQDDWWLAAQQSGLMSIENHSWDHNHGVLDNQNINDDSFRCINDQASCDEQVRQAQAGLSSILQHTYQPQYFAYPYGNYSDYLRHEYLPEFGPELNLKAAFTTEPKHVDRSSDLWALPRYVCNNDWGSPEELQRLLLNSNQN